MDVTCKSQKKQNKNKTKPKKQPPTQPGGVGPMRVNTAPAEPSAGWLFLRAFLFSFPNIIVSKVLVGFYEVLICCPLKCNNMLDK